MYAVVVRQRGGPEVLELVRFPDPAPEPARVVVAVQAAGVNPTDLAARVGKVRGQARMPYVLGWDFAGQVLEAAPDVAGWRAGDPVLGMVPWYDIGGSVGAYTSHLLTDAAWLVRRTQHLDAVTAATLPLAGLTAVQALDALGMPASCDVLVTGASGAVGGFAVQLAARRGHRVTALGSSGDMAWCGSLGAEVAVERLAEFSGRSTFRYVLDAVPLGPPVLPLVADGGRVVTTRRTPPPDRSVEQVDILVRPDPATLAELAQLLAAGSLRTRVAATLPLAEAARAHALVEGRGLRGKVVLTP
jgi:NADPH2:quinone reductase